MHKDFKESRVSAFVCDLTVDDLMKEIPPSSIDIVTMVFKWKLESISLRAYWTSVRSCSLINNCIST